MSGGSYSYKYLHVLELADEIAIRANGNPQRLALAKHMRDVAEACRGIEWRDSYDWSEEQEARVIERALERGAIESASLENIRKTLDSIRRDAQ